MIDRKYLLDSFLKYVRYDTMSVEGSDSVPSSRGQLDLADELVRDLKSLGVPNTCAKNGYVYAVVNGAPGRGMLGFIAHLDTSPDAPGKDVNPLVHYNYDGGSIPLSGGTVLSADDFPELAAYRGDTIITADGTTLLGADNKAGVAIIMSVVKALMSDENRPSVCFAFTVDEEIGRGMDAFDLALFPAKYAFTVDGGAAGELEYETFNAAKAVVEIRGRSVHPGSAKGKMINAALIACEFASLLPSRMTPENTEGYEGFFHLTSVNSSVERAELSYIIRDHDSALFSEKKKMFADAIEHINLKYGPVARAEITDQYYNMREKIFPAMHIVDIAREAIEMTGVTPVIKPVRGGTDGARLSFMGIPCPNIFTGGHNFHGRYEYAVLESMCKSAEAIVNIIKLWEAREA